MRIAGVFTKAEAETRREWAANVTHR